MAEAHRRVFRHRLKLKAQDAQLVHYPSHAVGHHTQILGTYEHTCGIDQARQLLHSLEIPELVVAAIEVVVIQTVEYSLVAVVQAFVDEVELNGNSRVEQVGVLVVAHEEHVADKGIEAVSKILQIF